MIGVYNGYNNNSQSLLTSSIPTHLIIPTQYCDLIECGSAIPSFFIRSIMNINIDIIVIAIVIVPSPSSPTITAINASTILNTPNTPVQKLKQNPKSNAQCQRQR
jgi:hypothetical protein